MALSRTTYVALALAATLACTGCSDSTSPRLQAQEVPQTSEQQRLLLQVLDRLDEVETHLDEVTTAINHRLDSLSAVAHLANVAQQAPGQPGQPNTGSGLASQIADVYTRTDSIMTLVDFLAKGAAQPWQGFTVCGGLGLKGVGELKSRTMATGEGQGGVGVKPWDTGALAQIALAERYIVDLGAGAEVQAGVSGCVDLSKIGTVVPYSRAQVTSAPFRAAAITGTDQLQATLMNLKDQLGLDPSRLDGALSQTADIFQSGDLTRLVELPSALHGPSALGSPLSVVRSRLSQFDPVGLLCGGGSFGSRIGPYVTQGCQLIQNGDLPDISAYPLFSNNLSNLSSGLSSLQSRFGSLCTRFNDVIGRRLVVNTNLPWGGSNSLDVQLFPSSWSVGCG